MTRNEESQFQHWKPHHQTAHSCIANDHTSRVEEGGGGGGGLVRGNRYLNLKPRFMLERHFFVVAVSSSLEEEEEGRAERHVEWGDLSFMFRSTKFEASGMTCIIFTSICSTGGRECMCRSGDTHVHTHTFLWFLFTWTSQCRIVAAFCTAANFL